MARPTILDVDIAIERLPRAGKDLAADRFPTSSGDCQSWNEADTCCSSVAHDLLSVPEPAHQAALQRYWDERDSLLGAHYSLNNIRKYIIYE